MFMFPCENRQTPGKGPGIARAFFPLRGWCSLYGSITTVQLYVPGCRFSNVSDVSSKALLYEIGLYIGCGSGLGVSPAPHLAFRIFTSFKGFFFLLRHPTLRLFAPSTGFLLLFCAQFADLFLGGVVLGRVGAHRR